MFTWLNTSDFFPVIAYFSGCLYLYQVDLDKFSHCEKLFSQRFGIGRID